MIYIPIFHDISNITVITYTRGPVVDYVTRAVSAFLLHCHIQEAQLLLFAYSVISCIFIVTSSNAFQNLPFLIDRIHLHCPLRSYVVMEY